jgi:hypothetical protein
LIRDFGAVAQHGATQRSKNLTLGYVNAASDRPGQRVRIRFAVLTDTGGKSLTILERVVGPA